MVHAVLLYAHRQRQGMRTHCNGLESTEGIEQITATRGTHGSLCYFTNFVVTTRAVPSIVSWHCLVLMYNLVISVPYSFSRHVPNYDVVMQLSFRYPCLVLSTSHGTCCAFLAFVSWVLKCAVRPQYSACPDKG